MENETKKVVVEKEEKDSEEVPFVIEECGDTMWDDALEQLNDNHKKSINDELL